MAFDRSEKQEARGTTPKRFAGWVAAAAVAAALFVRPAACAEAENLTGGNETLFLKKSAELRETEFIKMERGRARLDPMPYPLLEHAAAALYAPESLLDAQLASYRNALKRFQDIQIERPEWGGVEKGRTLAAMLEARLVELYDLEEEIDRAESIDDLWAAVEGSRFEMQSIPARFELGLNVMAWMDKFYGGEDWPESAFQALLSLAGVCGTPTDPIAYSKEMDDLHARAARLFLDEIKKERGEW